MKIFWKAEILEMDESDIFYVERGASHDRVMEKWLWPLVVALWAFLFLKFALQNGIEKPVFTATFEMPQRANVDSDVIES